MSKTLDALKAVVEWWEAPCHPHGYGIRMQRIINNMVKPAIAEQETLESTLQALKANEDHLNRDFSRRQSRRREFKGPYPPHGYGIRMQRIINNMVKPAIAEQETLESVVEKTSAEWRDAAIRWHDSHWSVKAQLDKAAEDRNHWKAEAERLEKEKLQITADCRCDCHHQERKEKKDAD